MTYLNPYDATKFWPNSYTIFSAHLSCRDHMLLFPSNMRISTLKLHDVTVLTLCRNGLQSDAAEIVSLNIKTTGPSTYDLIFPKC
jgi:hypothetical protein